ncbi:MAG: hypothetical protein AB1899_06145 [Pseudomonadota bacterium]
MNRVGLAVCLACLFLGLPVGAAEPVKFADELYAKFQHPRCLTCHQFNSRRSNGKVFNSHRNRFLCDNCHTQRISGMPRGEWMAPPEAMDYTGLGPEDTCKLIKRNMGSSDARLAAHMLDDPRIFWALDNGMTPAGKFPSAPGGSADWLRAARAWIADGMHCE